MGRYCEATAGKECYFLPIALSKLPGKACSLGRRKEEQTRPTLRSVSTLRLLNWISVPRLHSDVVYPEPLASALPLASGRAVLSRESTFSHTELTKVHFRFKDQMWQKVATEMGIPWRSAESMHWQLGEQEMSARANAPVFQLHPSATATGSPPQAHNAPAPQGFTPLNAGQLVPSPSSLQQIGRAHV